MKFYRLTLYFIKNQCIIISMKAKKISLLITLCAAMSAFSLTGCDSLIQLLPESIQSIVQNATNGGNQGGENQQNSGNNNQNQGVNGNTSGGNTSGGSYAIVGDLQNDFGGYYASISRDAKGTELLNQLHTLNDSKRKRTVSYDGMKTISKQTDTAPGANGKIVSFYSRQLIGPSWDSAKTWNREHVWPKSLGGDRVEKDGHMVRPCSTKDNGDRGNDVYATSGAYDPGSMGYPNYRGIAARIIFYCAIADTSLKIASVKKGTSNTMGYLPDLLSWNDKYPPNTSPTADLELQVEQNRNNVLAQTSIQGNRNPFIDHPEFAMRIWGNI